MLRSTIVGLVAVLLIAKIATNWHVILPNTADRTESRTFSPEHTKNFEVRAENGSIEFEGQNDPKAEIEITSILHASGPDEESAQAALDDMEVMIEGMEPGKEKETCKVGWRWKTTPKPEWSGSVSFKIQAPHKINVDFEAQNGALNVSDAAGTVKLKSQNGKIVSDTSGPSLDARTSNGVIEAKYSGHHLQLHAQNGTVSADLSHAAAIDGEVSTHNGAVTVTVGDDTSCELKASTVHGRVMLPNQKKGFMKRLLKQRSAHATFGKGGGTLKVDVQNGMVKVRHVKADSDSSDDDEDDSND
jgi:hypothetical protein